MCGIIGYIGNKKAAEIIIGGLKRLEYRGYDSVGMSVFENGNISTIKSSGKVIDLDNNNNNLKGTVGMGHTRWATHGPPNLVNAHPHSSSDNKIHLIHNGVIENYKPLKKFLIDKGIVFKSDTDSEVIVQLISYIYETEKVFIKEAM